MRADWVPGFRGAAWGGPSPRGRDSADAHGQLLPDFSCPRVTLGRGSSVEHGALPGRSWPRDRVTPEVCPVQRSSLAGTHCTGL